MVQQKKYPSPLLTVMLACAGVAWVLLAQPALAQTAPETKPASVKLPSSERFSTTTAAAQHCPGGTVVWSTLSKSKTFHLSSSKYYGKTKHGAYVCEKDAVAAGFRAAKK